ncbi:MAG: Hsp20/alpha crystallin family protein [Candidatus Geothermincolia bacterium]
MAQGMGSGIGALRRMRLQDRLDELMRPVGEARRRVQSLRRQCEWSPDVDIFARGNDLVIKAELPGLEPEEIDVELADGSLAITGEKRNGDMEEAADYLRMERCYGRFCRCLAVPCRITQEQVRASLLNGILEVVVPGAMHSSSHRSIRVSVPGPRQEAFETTAVGDVRGGLPQD